MRITVTTTVLSGSTQTVTGEVLYWGQTPDTMAPSRSVPCVVLKLDDGRIQVAQLTGSERHYAVRG